MFGVFDNNKPASVEGYPKLHRSWKTHKFETFKEAEDYANNYLGKDFGPIKFILNQGIEYGYGEYNDSIIIIREI